MRSLVRSISRRNRARIVNPRIPSIEAPGRPRAFIPTSWNGSSTRAFRPVSREPPSRSSRSTGVQNSSAVWLQADLLGRLGCDEKCRCARVDQEIERALAVDPRPDQEMVGIGEPVGHLERLADLRIVLWCRRLLPLLPSQGTEPALKPARSCQHRDQPPRNSSHSFTSWMNVLVPKLETIPNVVLYSNQTPYVFIPPFCIISP